MMKFIAIEGTDGSGKTTIRQYLFNKLSELSGTRPLATIPFSWLDPQSSCTIVNSKYGWEKYDENDIINAYVHDKELLYQKIVKPHLEYRDVIVDRYYVSDIVFHSIINNISMSKTIDRYKSSQVGEPDIWIYVKTDPELAYERIVKRNPNNIHKWEKRDLIKRFHERFNEVMSTIPPEKLIVLENNGSQFDLVEQLNNKVLNLITY